MARHQSSGNSGKAFEYAAHYVATVATIIPRLGRLLDTAGSLAGFRLWARGQGNVKVFRCREDLWERAILPRLADEKQGTVVEFGVAFGEGMRWWTDRLKSPNFRFFGFDRFMGLPRSWRDMPAGAFDTGGEPPLIEDSRVEWVVGDLEQTLGIFNWESLTGPKAFMFDVDLFGVSKRCFDCVLPHLRTGDIVYFDEAFDADERTLINDVLIPTDQFEILAISPLGVAYLYR